MPSGKRDPFCAVPGCWNRLSEANTTGVCRQHNHYPDRCGCAQCRQGEVPRYRIKTRAELVAEGLLLPEPPLTPVPSPAKEERARASERAEKRSKGKKGVTHPPLPF
jgi:hypothetical protein